MLSIFRTNHILTSILLIFYILLLWGSLFMVPSEWLPEATGIFTNDVWGWLSENNWLNRGVAIFLLLFNATILNYIVSEHRIEYETTLFPGLFYILVSSAIPDFLHLSPILMANTFLIFALFNLVKTYKNNNCASLIFDIGFWVAVASLFYFSFAFFTLWGLVCLSVLRASKLKEWLMIISGFLLPYLLIGTYFFWFDQFGEFWTQQVSQNLSFLSFNGNSDITTTTKLVCFSLLILFALGSAGMYNFKKNIQIQKKITVLYWLLFFAGITVLFQTNVTIAHFQIIAVPIGIFLAMSFSNMTSRWAESFHFLLLVLILALQFKNILI
ncbi:MAG: hypothetical protein ACI9XO_000196 [Paraglaciecola sp.]